MDSILRLVNEWFWQWMMIGPASIACLAWLRTGRSPFVWLIWAALYAEAIRAQAWRSAELAARAFVRALPARVDQVRREVLG